MGQTKSKSKVQLPIQTVFEKPIVPEKSIQVPVLPAVQLSTQDQLVIAKLKNLLLANQNTNSKKEKIQIVREVFTCLSDNRWFLEKHAKLAETTKFKIIEFMNDGWPEARLFGLDLFPNEIAFQKQVEMISDNNDLDIQVVYHDQLQDQIQDKTPSAPDSEPDLHCRICLDHKINTIFMPCMHMYFCSSCASKVKICSICNREIEKSVMVYVPF